MKAMLALLSALGLFFMLLNTLGGVVSGIWLAFLGEWWAIGFGLLSVFVSSFVISIALMPGLALTGGAVAFGRRSKMALLFFGALSNLYVVFVMTVWCLGALVFFMSGSTPDTWIPLLIWSYGVATGPWSYMASQESRGGGGEASVTAAFFGQVAYVAMVLVGIFASASIMTMGKVFAGIMLISVVMQLILTYSLADQFQLEQA